MMPDPFGERLMQPQQRAQHGDQPEHAFRQESEADAEAAAQQRPVERNAHDPVLFQEQARPVLGSPSVHEIQSKADVEQHYAACYGGEQHGPHALQWPEPSGAQHGLAERGAVKQAEQHAARARGRHQDAEVQTATPQPHTNEEQQQAMSEIAEHHAVHDEKADGDDQGRVELLIGGEAEGGDQFFEWLQPARASHQAGNALPMRIGLEHFHRYGMAGGALHRLLQPVQVGGRHPARNQKDFAVFREAADRFGEFCVCAGAAPQAG